MRNCLFVLMFAALPVQADTRFLAGLGFAHGGDKLTTVEFTDGSSETLRAGSGIAFNAGVVHHFIDAPFSIQASFGYLLEDTAASNSNIRFSRDPLEVLGCWRNGDHRCGGGLVHHFSPTFDMDNLGPGKVEFDDATGFALEYGWRFISVRYTGIEYSFDTPFGSAKVDGNGLGVYLTYGF